MKILPFMLAGSALLLSGCAGMKSEFDCTETADNGCLTMDEANNRARAKTEGDKPQVRLPKLAEVTPVSVEPSVTSVSVASSRTPVVTAPASVAVAPVRPSAIQPAVVAGSAPHNPFRGGSTPARPAGTSPAPVTTTSVSGMTVASTSAPSAWADTGMQPPVRLPAGTARLWIAAWVDEDQVYHQPSVVSFEVAPARWATQEGN
ncbi:type IV conjugative transfer system lipoprotein TraV [Salmonella enterica subsp. enterica serovar Hvittingfoss]|nr:type IV conjugative transfer system lipoprotein TraV [Salmonella enterica subsp. enterica serovar Hvittingfoss]